MANSKNISETLNTLANFYIESYKDTVGDAPNDYFVTDLPTTKLVVRIHRKANSFTMRMLNTNV